MDPLKLRFATGRVSPYVLALEREHDPLGSVRFTIGELGEDPLITTHLELPKLLGYRRESYQADDVRISYVFARDVARFDVADSAATALVIDRGRFEDMLRAV